MRRVIVCGGRDYEDAARVDLELDALHMADPFVRLCHGGAGGADRLAGRWAERACVTVVVFPADWPAHGRAAGPKRNQTMLELGRPDLVVAFPGGRGTADIGPARPRRRRRRPRGGALKRELAAPPVGPVGWYFAPIPGDGEVAARTLFVERTWFRARERAAIFYGVTHSAVELVEGPIDMGGGA